MITTKNGPNDAKQQSAIATEGLDNEQKWRIGRFDIAVKIVLMNNFAEVLGLMKFIPYTVYLDFLKEKFVYVGTSSLFDKVIIGSPIPEYSVSIRTPKGNICVKAKRL